MRAFGMKSSVKVVLWWAGEMLLAALFQLLPPLIFSQAVGEATGSLLLYTLCLYALQPLASLVVPFFLTSRKGVNPYAAFFPFGLFLLASPAYASGTAVGLVCLLLGLFSAAAGQEFKKRRDAGKKT